MYVSRIQLAVHLIEFITVIGNGGYILVITPYTYTIVKLAHSNCPDALIFIKNIHYLMQVTVLFMFCFHVQWLLQRGLHTNNNSVKSNDNGRSYTTLYDFSYCQVMFLWWSTMTCHMYYLDVCLPSLINGIQGPVLFLCPFKF